MSLESIKSHKTFEGLTQFWQHDSSETKTKMNFSTFTPIGTIRGCLIWLSGLTCTEENFISKAGAQRALARYQMMAICPDTSPRGITLPAGVQDDDFGLGAGFYVDATEAPYKDNFRMFSYVSLEIPALLKEEFNVNPDRLSISGHSMGGHGALVLGLREPKKFKSVSAFSPIANPIHAPWGQKAFSGYLGSDETTWRNYDATELLKEGKRHPRSLLVDQGTRDSFFEKQLLTNNLLRACEDHRQPAQINFRQGYDHSYYFIATYIDTHIAFHAAALG